MTKIIIIGGGREPYKVEVIDLETSSTTCSGIVDYPLALDGGVGALLPNQQPLVCGGRDSGYVRQNACYSLENGQWLLFNLLNEKRHHAAISLSPYPSNDFSVIISGGSRSSGSMDTVEILNQNEWDLSSIKMPKGINDHCMVQINLTSVMIVGGYNSSYLDETYLFNAETEEWTPGPPLQVARRGLSCARIKTSLGQSFFSIISVAGYNGEYLNTVEILDEVSGNWKSGPPLPVNAYHGTLVEDPAGGVIMIGGKYQDSGYHNTLYRLSHAGPDATWFKMPQKLQNARRYHVSFLVPEEITNCTLD